MKKILIGFAAAMIATHAMAYDSLLSLMTDYARKERESTRAIHAEESRSLLEFIATHTNAHDLAEAQITAAGLLQELDNPARALPLFEAGYAAMIARGTNANLRGIQRTVEGIFRIKLALESKASASNFIKRVRTDFAASPEITTIAQICDDFSIDLQMPVVGETMKIKFKAVDGRVVDLSSMTGRVVLVDFWATWCGYCVAELPNVRDAYEKFHDKGFEVIGISLDKDKGELEKFVADRKLPWPQRFSGDWWEDEIARQFGIRSLPATYLIGKDGKVAAVDLHGEAFLKKVEELLN